MKDMLKSFVVLFCFNLDLYFSIRVYENPQTPHFYDLGISGPVHGLQTKIIYVRRHLDIPNSSRTNSKSFQKNIIFGNVRFGNFESVGRFRPTHIAISEFMF